MAALEQELATALAALMKAHDGLTARLADEPAWRALNQLDARIQAGDDLETVSATELRQRLEDRLNSGLPLWRLREPVITAIETLRKAGIEPATAPSAPATANDVSLDEGRSRSLVPLGAIPTAVVSQAMPLTDRIAASRQSLTDALSHVGALPAEASLILNPASAGVTAPAADNAAADSILQRIRSISTDESTIPSSLEQPSGGITGQIDNLSGIEAAAVHAQQPLRHAPLAASAELTGGRGETSKPALWDILAATRPRLEFRPGASDSQPSITVDAPDAEEAEIEIVALDNEISTSAATGTTAIVPFQPDNASALDSYAAYLDEIDEATVEIIELKPQVPALAGTRLAEASDRRIAATKNDSATPPVADVEKPQPLGDA